MLLVIAALVVGAAMWWQAADSGDQAALTAGAPVTEALPSPRTPQTSTPRRTSSPTESAPPPGRQLTAVYMTNMGQAVLDDTGAVLFRYEHDNPHKARSACLGDCAAVWIPITTAGTPTVTGIDPALVGTVKRPEGVRQVTLAGWPLYKFANARPGEWTGQGTDHVWFVIKPDGQRNLNCLPAPVQ
jgi:predicted lipoprotein with Yx(FWY)xxD motif